jgi:hypothetical protein
LPSPQLLAQLLTCCFFELPLLHTVDGPLQPLQVPANLPAGHPLASIIPTTNAAVAAWAAHSGQKASWLQLPWLTVECYLYVRVATIIASQVIAGLSAGFATQVALPSPAQLAADAAACLSSVIIISSHAEWQHVDEA